MGNLGNKGSRTVLSEIFEGGELFPMFPKNGPKGPFQLEKCRVSGCRIVTFSVAGIAHTALRIERE